MKKYFLSAILMLSWPACTCTTTIKVMAAPDSATPSQDDEAETSHLKKIMLCQEEAGFWPVMGEFIFREAPPAVPPAMIFRDTQPTIPHATLIALALKASAIPACFENLPPLRDSGGADYGVDYNEALRRPLDYTNVPRRIQALHTACNQVRATLHQKQATLIQYYGPDYASDPALKHANQELLFTERWLRALQDAHRTLQDYECTTGGISLEVKLLLPAGHRLAPTVLQQIVPAHTENSRYHLPGEPDPCGDDYSSNAGGPDTSTDADVFSDNEASGDYPFRHPSSGDSIGESLFDSAQGVTDSSGCSRTSSAEGEEAFIPSQRLRQQYPHFIRHLQRD